MARTSIFLCFLIVAVSNQLVVTDLIPNSTMNSDIHESIQQYNAPWRSVMELYNETNTVDPNKLVILQNLINEKNNLTSNLKSSLQNLYDVAKSIDDNYKTFEQLVKTVEQSPNSTNSFNKFFESVENISNSSSAIKNFFNLDDILQSVLDKQLSIQNLTACDLIVNLFADIIEITASRNYVIQYTANYLKGNSEKCEEITRTYGTISVDITNKFEAAYSTASKSNGCH